MHFFLQYAKGNVSVEMLLCKHMLLSCFVMFWHFLIFLSPPNWTNWKGTARNLGTFSGAEKTLDTQICTLFTVAEAGQGLSENIIRMKAVRLQTAQRIVYHCEVVGYSKDSPAKETAGINTFSWSRKEQNPLIFQLFIFLPLKLGRFWELTESPLSLKACGYLESLSSITVWLKPVSCHQSP